MAGGTDYSKFKPIAVFLAAMVLSYTAWGIWNILTTPILGVMFCPGYEICRVYAGSPAEGAGIRLGDKVLTVDGASVKDVGPLGMGPARPGDVRIYGIERQGEVVQIEVSLQKPPPRSTYLRLGPTIVGLAFILTGGFVFFNRPARISGVYFLFCLTVGWILSNPPRATGTNAKFLVGALEITAWFASVSLLVYFSWIFPRYKRLIQRNPKLVMLLFSFAILVAGALILALAYTLLLGLDVPHRVLVLLDYFAGVTIIGYFGLAAGSSIHGYFTTPAGSVKRSLRLVLVASLVGVLPVITYSVLFAIDPHLELPLEGHVVLFVLLIPMALGYSVFHRLSGETDDPMKP